MARRSWNGRENRRPESARPDIISLAERFAQADEGMWGAARAMGENAQAETLVFEPSFTFVEEKAAEPEPAKSLSHKGNNRGVSGVVMA